MADERLKRDENKKSVLGGITDDANLEVRNLRVEPASNALIVKISNISALDDRYLVLLGRAAGQTANGGTTGSGMDLTLQSNPENNGNINLGESLQVLVDGSQAGNTSFGVIGWPNGSRLYEQSGGGDPDRFFYLANGDRWELLNEAGNLFVASFRGGNAAQPNTFYMSGAVSIGSVYFNTARPDNGLQVQGFTSMGLGFGNLKSAAALLHLRERGPSETMRIEGGDDFASIQFYTDATGTNARRAIIGYDQAGGGGFGTNTLSQSLILRGEDGISMVDSAVVLLAMRADATRRIGVYDETRLGFGFTTDLTTPDVEMGWDETDANANHFKVDLPTGGVVNVPVHSIGIGSLGVDLGLFNGITDPTVAVLAADRLSATLIQDDGTDTIISNTDSNALIRNKNIIALDNGLEERYYDVGNSNYVGFKAPALVANQIWALPAADGAAGDIVKTDGAGNLDFVTATVEQDISFEIYDPEPSRASESAIHGGLLSLATAQPLNSVPTNIVVTKGIGKVMIVINAGSDFTGDITITGDTIDRETGAKTVADTNVISVDALSTDGSDTDGNGNTRHSFTGAYISSKWFTGTVTLSTANLTLTDVDVYHVSFEQFNDSPNLVLNTFDVNLDTTNVNAQFDAYLYCLEVTGSKCDISRCASLNVGTDGETAIANKYWRLRRGNINFPFDGTMDGIWVDIHYSNSPAYVEDMTMKVWATKTVPITLT
jgi:hypothetical protein